jgi:hypothetical protein
MQSAMSGPLPHRTPSQRMGTAAVRGQPEQKSGMPPQPEPRTSWPRLLLSSARATVSGRCLLKPQSPENARIVLITAARPR